MLAFALGPWQMFWIFFYGFATYGNAGWMREQVCKYMCPYARFQGAMFDQDTLIIAYDRERGDPRGARGKKADPKALGLGDCVDCDICVQVCPTGIDIRDGLQYECIGCAACIDGCDQVMEKMGYPKGLIRYSTEHAMQEHSGLAGIVKRIVRPRTLVYTAILATVVVAAAVALWMRVPLKVDVIRDRGAMVREVEDGELENVYRLQVMNATESAHRYRITVEGLPGIARGLRAGDRDGARLHPRLPGAHPRARRRRPKGGSQKIVITRDRRGRERPAGAREGRLPLAAKGRELTAVTAERQPHRRASPGTASRGPGSSWPGPAIGGRGGRGHGGHRLPRRRRAGRRRLLQAGPGHQPRDRARRGRARAWAIAGEVADRAGQWPA